jgi:hypothetical protein
MCFLAAFDLNYEQLKVYSKCFIQKPISIKDLVQRVKAELQLFSA